MKRDFYTNPRPCALRVLNAFMMTLFHMLTLQSFDSITVNDLCQHAGYPRATFYNYFNDKNDIFDYFMFRIKEYMKKNTPDDEQTFTGFFSTVFDFLFLYEKRINRIIELNEPGSYLFLSIQSFISQAIKKQLTKENFHYNSPLPENLLADYYSQVFLIVLRYRFDGKCTDTKEQLLDIISKLLHEDVAHA